MLAMNFWIFANGKVPLLSPLCRAGFRGIDTACQPKHYQEDLVGKALQRLAVATWLAGS